MIRTATIATLAFICVLLPLQAGAQTFVGTSKTAEPKNQSVADLQSRLDTILKELAAVKARIGEVGTTPKKDIPTTTTHNTPNFGGGGGSPSSNPSAKICNNISIPGYFHRGNSGEGVRSLQKFLVSVGKLDAAMATGYFGANTESALGQWQVENKVVSGFGKENGWGEFGDKTRMAISRSCGTGSSRPTPPPPIKPLVVPGSASKSCEYIKIAGLVGDKLMLPATGAVRPELTWRGTVTRTTDNSGKWGGAGTYQSTADNTRWTDGMGLVMTGPNGKPFAGIENEDAVGVASKSTVSSPENLVFQAGALAGEYTVTARHIGDNTMTSYVCSKTFTVVPAKKATTTTQIGTTTQSVAKLTTTKFIGASSTIIRVTRIPTEVKKKITACEYGWNRRAGSGITVDWGDGTVLSGSPDDKVPGTPCAGLTSHEYPHGLPGTQMYTIRMRTWHPGPTDAPVTDWEGTATVSIK